MPIAVVQIRREPYYRSDAFTKGLKRNGYTFEQPHVNPKDSRDLLVLWNRKRGADHDKATDWERRGGTVLIAENGYLQKTDKTIYALSVHGHNGSGWYPYDDSEDRFSALGFKLKPWGGDGNIILVCGQRGIGSPEMASPPMWAERLAHKLGTQGMKIRLRLHPGNFAPKVPLTQDLMGVQACYIWSSGSGVRALVEGVPVKHHAPHWICAGAGAENREQMLNRMAHGQWGFEEIESGEPFARILDKLGEAKW